MFKPARTFWIGAAVAAGAIALPVVGVYMFAHSIPNLERAPSPTWICDFACEATRLDLIAQQNMAQAAWGVIGLAIVSFAASVLTLLFLYQTVKEGKLTRAEASRSAKAAEDSVEESRRLTEITSRHAMMQARAYVSASGCSMMITNGGPQFQLTYTNSGQSPARSPSVSWHLGLELRPKDGDPYEWPGEALNEEVFLPEIPAGGGDIIVGVCHSLSELQRLLPAERLGRAIILLEGHFKYQDVFEEWQTDHFGFVLAFQDGPIPGTFGLTRKPLGSSNRY